MGYHGINAYFTSKELQTFELQAFGNGFSCSGCPKEDTPAFWTDGRDRFVVPLFPSPTAEVT